MKNAKDITFDTKILDKIIIEKCCQIPGIDAKKPIEIFYKTEDGKKIVDVRCSSIATTINLHTLCLQTQKTIYNYLLVQFDLDPTQLEINIYLIN